MVVVSDSCSDTLASIVKSVQFASQKRDRDKEKRGGEKIEKTNMNKLVVTTEDVFFKQYKHKHKHNIISGTVIDN